MSENKCHNVPSWLLTKNKLRAKGNDENPPPPKKKKQKTKKTAVLMDLF